MVYFFGNTCLHLITGTGSNESAFTGTACSSTTDMDIQQSSLNFEFGKAAECIKQLLNNAQLLEQREEIRME